VPDARAPAEPSDAQKMNGAARPQITWRGVTNIGMMNTRMARPTRNVARNWRETGFVISTSNEPSRTRAESWNRFIMKTPA